ncbi:MAG: hypothetical protein NC324_02240 [Bacteroides sp.]|nr:hypothetical protein [Bacteroides sp.]
METFMEWKPPRTKEELDAAFERAMASREYFDRIIRFTYTMKRLEWYSIDRFVRRENIDRFRTCICVLIACLKFDLEFDSGFARIRKI